MTKISATTDTTTPLSTDMLPMARSGDTTARKITVGNLQSYGVNAAWYSGADAGAKINAAIQDNDGGVVFVPISMGGSFSTQIVIDRSIRIEFEAENPSAGSFTYTGSDWAIKIQATSSLIAMTRIRNLSLAGNANALGGVLIDNAAVNPSDAQVPFGELDDCAITGFTKAGAWGVRFNAANTNTWTLTRCHVAGNTNGIYKTDYLGGALRIISGEIGDHSTGIGLSLYDNIGAYLYGVNITNNLIGIALDGAKNFTMYGCYMEGTGAAASVAIQTRVVSGITSSGIISGTYMGGGASVVNLIDLGAASVAGLTISNNRLFNCTGAAILNSGGTNWGTLMDNEQDTVGSLISAAGNFRSFSAAPAVLATGASHTVDEVITVLQDLGLVKQS